MKGKITHEKYVEIKTQIDEVNTLKADEASKIKDLSDECRIKCNAIKSEIKEKIDKATVHDIVFIHRLNTSHLPFDKLSKVVKISLDEELDEEQQNEQVAVILKEFKLELLELSESGKFNRNDYSFPLE